VRILIAIGVPRQREAGAAGVVINHKRELERRGHTVECWFLEDVFERPPRFGRFEALIFGMGVAKRVLRERDRFDVVNIHAPWACVYGVWRKLLHPTGAPPYVMTMQGCDEHWVHIMRREHRKGRAWHFGWKNRLWHRVYERPMYHYSISTADYGVVANREGWIFSELACDRDPGRIRFVPNGTEERFFVKHEYADRTPLVLLYVGTWLDRKGIYYLAEAFEYLAQKISGIELTVAGCLQPEEQVKKFFAAGVRDRVHVVPLVKREDMPAVYAEHDIFVFPSLSEGMPLTLLEAMAAGMPVVTTETSGMADVVEDGFNGLLVPPADTESLVEAIERLLRSADLRKRLGQQAQETMRRYTWELVTRKLEEVLTSAAQNGERK
jgi:glycosyltransferase involved in cell wall biosynthesis